jgi:hypothetical protein
MAKNEEIIQKLNVLQAAAEKACREAYSKRHLVDDAVNWADLHCHEAKWCIDQYGHEFFEVVIEEASPSASNLMRFIDNHLKANGFDAVVMTEW